MIEAMTTDGLASCGFKVGDLLKLGRQQNKFVDMSKLKVRAGQLHRTTTRRLQETGAAQQEPQATADEGVVPPDKGWDCAAASGLGCSVTALAALGLGWAAARAARSGNAW